MSKLIFFKKIIYNLKKMEENTIYTWKFLDEKQRGAFWYIIDNTD